MLQAPSRASTSSSSSFIPVSRQNTMSSHDGRSVRQSKRYSMSALYLSMSAKEKDLEIEDDLARGRWPIVRLDEWTACSCCNSSEGATRTQSQNLITIKEELRVGEGRAILGLPYCTSHSESNGSRRGMHYAVYLNHVSQSLRSCREKKWQATWKIRPTSRKATSQTTNGRNATATSFSFYNLNLDTLRICAG